MNNAPAATVTVGTDVSGAGITNIIYEAGVVDSIAATKIGPYTLSKIAVKGDDCYITLTDGVNPTVLTPWDGGVSLKADDLAAVPLSTDGPDGYSYSGTNSGLSAALKADVTALIIASL